MWKIMPVKEPISRRPVILLALWAPGLLLPGCGAGPKVQQLKPAVPGPEQTDLFTGAQGGYHSYRSSS
jgi:hypothetical protein